MMKGRVTMNQLPLKGYLFITINKTKNMSIPSGTIVKTNKDLKIVEAKNTEFLHKEDADLIHKWIENPNEYRFVSPSYEDFSIFIRALEKYVQSLPRNYVRIIKSRYWNVQSEILYRLKCPAHLHFEQICELFEISSLIQEGSSAQECHQLVMLTDAYLSDRKTVKSILERGYKNHLRERFSQYGTDRLIQEILKRGLEVCIRHSMTIDEVRTALVTQLIQTFEVEEGDKQ